jgi:LacI family transcriptional regulator
MREVSLKTLSRQLGLTEGTVSRALNGYSDISPRTRERVHTVARRLGYHPNSNARRLATGNAESIGYILPWHTQHMADPFLGRLLDGISETLSERHWDLTVTVPRSHDDEIATLKRFAMAGRVGGVVISRTLLDDPRVETLRGLGLPFVTHGRTAQSDDHAWFDVDNMEAIRAATLHLAGLGHRRIAHIHGPLAYNYASERLAGYRQALAETGITHDAGLEVGSDADLASGYVAMQKLLESVAPPTAVVCVTDSAAIGAMKAIREGGRLPGREISVIGYDGIPMGEHTFPALTTMAQPLEQAGRRIAEMLIAVIEGADPARQQVIVPAKLIRRETDGPPITYGQKHTEFKRE